MTYSVPYFAISTAYTLKVDSTIVKVAKNIDYSFAQLFYSGTVTFKVTAKDTITSYDISPHSYGIEATVSGKDLTFEGITLRDGTTWNFRIQDATNVNIKNVKIINNVNWIHGDDVCDANSSPEEPMTDVVFKNSVAFTESAGIKVGMQGSASVSDIWFKNIDVMVWAKTGLCVLCPHT
ncbi:hypothetical protein ACP8HI_20330 [Paenibacillus sp. FA6]|uniref:hypothetical protein n=1 Tax=Paenibacillus sp. FA6 TaxID=3413029 RepID=UPI003F65F06A